MNEINSTHNFLPFNNQFIEITFVLHYVYFNFQIFQEIHYMTTQSFRVPEE